MNSVSRFGAPMLALSAALGGAACYAEPLPPPPPPTYVEPAPAPPVGAYAAPGSDYATVYPSTPAPEPIPEYRPAAPGYGYMWVDGFWDWTGYDWSWSAGYWVPQR